MSTHHLHGTSHPVAVGFIIASLAFAAGAAATSFLHAFAEAIDWPDY
ncbi:hypothetical protein [Arthrobacter oryzae]|nr:hypothetical protein [Arthrobacter oryzae]MDQ0078520.1 hypothetical protein [Arthrobacter oryzae]